MLISIDEYDGRPLYVQILTQIKEQIREGQLKPGDELPSIRELAESLNINLHTVRHAYQELREQGLVTFRLGQQARVAKLRSSPPDRTEIARALGSRLNELITEAFLMGLSAADFRRLVEERLSKQKE